MIKDRNFAVAKAALEKEGTPRPFQCVDHAVCMAQAVVTQALRDLTIRPSKNRHAPEIIEARCQAILFCTQEKGEWSEALELWAGMAGRDVDAVRCEARAILAHSSTAI